MPGQSNWPPDSSGGKAHRRGNLTGDPPDRRLWAERIARHRHSPAAPQSTRRQMGPIAFVEHPPETTMHKDKQPLRLALRAKQIKLLSGSWPIGQVKLRTLCHITKRNSLRLPLGWKAISLRNISCIGISIIELHPILQFDQIIWTNLCANGFPWRDTIARRLLCLIHQQTSNPCSKTLRS